MKSSSPPSSSPTSSSSSTSPTLMASKSKAKRLRRNLNPEKRQLGSSPGRRSSMYRGVTRHRWTGRYEAHLWDKTSWNPIQNKKGKQVYLGAYDDEEAAAHTYDLAALKYWGPDTILNFPLSTYAKEYEEMQSLSKEEYLATLRRRSSGFSRGVSKYRGVARHHHNGRWEARIGRVFGNKYLYLGTYSTQEEAAAAYDIAAIEYRGINAVTNFDISHYMRYIPTQTQIQSQTQTQTQNTSPFEGSNDMATVGIPLFDNTDSIDHMNTMDQFGEAQWNTCVDPAFIPFQISGVDTRRSNENKMFNGADFEDNIDVFFDGTEATVAPNNAANTQVGVGDATSASKMDDIFDDLGVFEGNFLNAIEQGGECGGLMEEVMSSSLGPTSYPFEISIC